MAEQLVFFTVYIFEAVIAYMYFNDNYNIKRKHLTSLFIVLCLYSLTFGINVIFHNNLTINLIMFFIINLVYCRLSFDISLKNAILHSSILLAIMMLSELIIETGASLLFDIPMDAYKHSFASLVILGTVEKVLYLLICKFISAAFSYKKNNTPNNLKRDFALFLYPIITTVMLLVFSYTSAAYQISDKINFVFITISILSMIFCCLIFIINQKIQIQENELIKLQTEKQKTEINRSFYALLDKKNEEQQTLAHNMKHHIYLLKNMSDIDEIKNYLKTIDPALDEYEYIGKSNNKMLDLILSKYHHICKTNNIEFEVDIRSCNLSFINDNDLTTMLGNLLDNAVEAAKGTEHAVIRFAAKNHMSFHTISIINSSHQAPKTRGEKLLTTKADPAFHGYGVKSVEKTAKKYNGVCEWFYDEIKKEFHFSIIFNQINDKKLKPSE